MAIYILPPGVDRRNRSVNGNTFTANSSGPIIRGRTMVKITNSKRTTRTKTWFRSVVSQWRTLSSGLQTQWNDHAATTPLINSLGVTYYLSGFQRFVSTNLLMLRHNLEQVVVPIPTLTPPPNLWTESVVSYDPPGFFMSIEQIPVQPDWLIFLWWSPIVSASSNLVFPNRFIIKGEFGLVDFVPQELHDSYREAYGDWPDPSTSSPENSTIFIHIVWMHDATKFIAHGDTIKSVYVPL